jgi:MFS family permease
LLLVVLTAFVGAMWGLERTAIPLIAKEDFGIASAAVSLSFIAGFGLTKTFANLFAGGLMDRVGRRGVLVMGWIVGLPVPFMIIWAPQWEWVVAANMLLGINQGLCWTATILMMMDMMGPGRRGFSTGLNEFVGYSGVATTTLAAGFIASTFAPRPHPFFLGIVLASLGLALSYFLVRETRNYSLEEAAESSPGLRSPSFRNTFVVSLRDRTLLGCNQAGLVTKINDATIWGLIPLFLDSQGLGVAKIGIVAAVFTQVWGVTQFGTGFLSDHVGRKPLISMGMVVQALGISLLALGDSFPVWIGGAAVMGIGTAAVYPTLIAAVGDHAHPLRRASSIGLYRWYRDGGFVVGAIIAGLLADALGFRLAFLFIGGISLYSAILVGVMMTEPSRRVDAVALV